MVERRPIVLKDGELQQLPIGDTLPGGSGGDLVIQSRQSFTTIADQTTFTVNPYTPGNLDVFLNGIHLNAADFVATSGTTVILAKAALVGSICEIISVETIAIAEIPDPTANIYRHFDGTYRTFSTTWAVGMTMPNFPKSAGNPILFMANMQMRNDNSSWGGSHNRLEYSVDDGVNWVSLGDTGYDGPMVNGGDSIGQWTMTAIIDELNIVAATQVRLRFQHKAYGGTLQVNGSSERVVGPNFDFGGAAMSIMEIKV